MPRKGENIYKRKDGRWEGRYIKSRTPAGKANYGYVYAKTYREVKAKLIDKSLAQISSATVSPEVSTDLFEYVAMEWFNSIWNISSPKSWRCATGKICIRLTFCMAARTE